MHYNILLLPLCVLFLCLVINKLIYPTVVSCDRGLKRCDWGYPTENNLGPWIDREDRSIDGIESDDKNGRPAQPKGHPFESHNWHTQQSTLSLSLSLIYIPDSYVARGLTITSLRLRCQLIHSCLIAFDNIIGN